MWPTEKIFQETVDREAEQFLEILKSWKCIEIKDEEKLKNKLNEYMYETMY
jgi:hypothetical protein